MEQELRQNLIDKYNNIFTNMQLYNIEATSLGFVEDNDCSLMLMPILIHCMENIELFDDERLNNISEFINKLAHVG